MPQESPENGQDERPLVEIFPELAPVIDSLRDRLERGDLPDIGPVTIGGATLPGLELAVKILLADLEHHTELAEEQRRQPKLVRRRLALAQDLRRVWQLLSSAP
jgi:hypothetical protein